MRYFKDITGRQWGLELTIGAVKRVKDSLGLDLLAPANPPGPKADERAKEVLWKGHPAPLVSVLNADASLLFDVIYLAIRPQLDKAGCNADDFVESMGGDAAYAAYEAFQAEWLDFFQKLHRPDAAKMVEKHRAMVEAQAKKNEATVERAAEAVERGLEKARERIEERIAAATAGDGATFTDLPDMSASTLPG
jgi:hypothetical protein